MEKQVLLEGDGCYTIILLESIIVNPDLSEVSIGSEVKYLWPEHAACKKQYSGKVIAISSECRS